MLSHIIKTIQLKSCQIIQSCCENDERTYPIGWLLDVDTSNATHRALDEVIDKYKIVIEKMLDYIFEYYSNNFTKINPLHMLRLGFHMQYTWKLPKRCKNIVLIEKYNNFIWMIIVTFLKYYDVKRLFEVDEHFNDYDQIVDIFCENQYILKKIKDLDEDKSLYDWEKLEKK
jgi:hypothetical protein